MKYKTLHALIFLLAVVAATLVFVNRGEAQRGVIHVQVPSALNRSGKERLRNFDAQITTNAGQFLTTGRETFRFDTFGDEAFWGGSLKLHEAIEGANLGGVGPGISPSTAIGLGLKVDVDALPQPLIS